MKYEVLISDEASIEIDVGPGLGAGDAPLRRATFVWEVYSEAVLREMIESLGGVGGFSFNPHMGRAQLSARLRCEGEAVGPANVVLECDGCLAHPDGGYPIITRLLEERRARCVRMGGCDGRASE